MTDRPISIPQSEFGNPNSKFPKGAYHEHQFDFVLVVIVVLLTSVGGATAHNGANAPSAAPQAAVGSGFTFQGQLKNAGATVNGNCDMTFRLYDAAATGTQIGSTITDQPILNLTAINDSPTVLGHPTRLTATVTGGTGAITTTWNFGDGTPLLIGNPVTHTYGVAGTYTATVTTTNGLSTLSATTRVTVTQHVVYLPFVTR